MDAKFYNPNRKEDDYKISIDINGQWFHDGSPMTRDALAKLFSTALYYNEVTDEYWLITPHEQGRIDVADAPFVAVDFEWDNDNLTLKTNLDEIITPNADNPIYCVGDKPYCRNARNIPVRINRMVREKLIDIALSQNGYDEGTSTLTLTANGHRHVIANS